MTGDHRSRRRYVPHCPWRNAVAVFMAAVTAGAWIPFARLGADPAEREDDEELTLPMRQILPSLEPTRAEKMFPRPGVDLVKKPKPVRNPVVDPTHAQPTPKVPVRLPPSVHPVPRPTPRPTTPTPRPPVTKPPVVVTPPPAPSSSASAKLVAFLRAQVGKPYVFGGNGPNVYDCSGLTKAAYASIGIRLPRTSEEQSLVGQRVPLSSLRTGDLVFYGVIGIAFHVGIYVGGGQIIAAQNPGTGVIQFSVGYYTPDFARRIL